METKSSKSNKELCIKLMEANTEDRVVSILTEAGYWNNDAAWRYYGDRTTNYNTIGNTIKVGQCSISRKTR